MLSTSLLRLRLTLSSSFPLLLLLLSRLALLLLMLVAIVKRIFWEIAVWRSLLQTVEIASWLLIHLGQNIEICILLRSHILLIIVFPLSIFMNIHIGFDIARSLNNLTKTVCHLATLTIIALTWAANAMLFVVEDPLKRFLFAFRLCIGSCLGSVMSMLLGSIRLVMLPLWCSSLASGPCFLLS